MLNAFRLLSFWSGCCRLCCSLTSRSDIASDTVERSLQSLLILLDIGKDSRLKIMAVIVKVGHIHILQICRFLNSTTFKELSAERRPWSLIIVLTNDGVHETRISWFCSDFVDNRLKDWNGYRAHPLNTSRIISHFKSKVARLTIKNNIFILLKILNLIQDSFVGIVHELSPDSLKESFKLLPYTIDLIANAFTNSHKAIDACTFMYADKSFSKAFQLFLFSRHFNKILSISSIFQIFVTHSTHLHYCRCL